MWRKLFLNVQTGTDGEDAIQGAGCGQQRNTRLEENDGGRNSEETRGVQSVRACNRVE